MTPPDKNQGEPEPDKEPPDRNGCNEDLQSSPHYKWEAQSNHYSQDIKTVPTFLLVPRILIDAYAVHNLQNYVRPGDQETPVQLPDTCNKRRGVPRAVDQLRAGPGPPIKVNCWVFL